MAFETLDPNTIHQTVQEPYGARARSASSCCGPSSDCCSDESATIALYSDEDVAGLPEEISGSTVHESVRSRYAAIAESVGQSASSCCSPTAESESCGCSSGIYTSIELDGLPVDVVNLSLGCGDPVSIASMCEGETVLDLGSGGGIDCFLAAQRVGEAGQVIGVDMTPAMLVKANANKAKMGVTNVEFCQGQIEDLPVEDNSVDVIMSNCVINLSPDKPAVFREALRVLKPGGRVSISDIVTDGQFSDELRADLAKWAECVTGAIDANAYIGMMQAAGFVDIQIVDKVDAEEIVPRREGMPRVFSARITAYKPV